MTRQEHRSEKLAALEAACRQHGLPLTVQRRVILDALAGRDDHPTADEILAQVRQRLPEVSRTTVYRVLDTLVRLGLAAKICSPGAGVRFDPKTDRHHHLVCVQCEKVMDFEAPTLNALRLPDVRTLAFTVQDYSIHFRGLCGECGKRVTGREKRGPRRPARTKGKSGMNQPGAATEPRASQRGRAAVRKGEQQP
jgi:Fur family peroxide stress response transcriptional regulator